MEYANGLIFSPSMEHVVVLEKQRPAPFKSRLFPPGGRIERGESPAICMSCEGSEEVGIFIPPEDWIPIALTRTQFDGKMMTTFFAISEDAVDARTCDDEEVFVRKTSDLVLQCIEAPKTVADDLLLFIALAKKAHASPQNVVHFDRWSEVDPEPEDGLFNLIVGCSPRP